MWPFQSNHNKPEFLPKRALERMANMHQRTTVVLYNFFFVFRRPSPVLIAQLCQTQNRPTENRFTVFVCTFARHYSDVWTTTSTCHRNRVLSTNKITRKPMIFGKCKSSTKIGQRFQQLTPESTEKKIVFRIQNTNNGFVRAFACYFVPPICLAWRKFNLSFAFSSSPVCVYPAYHRHADSDQIK